MQPANHRPFHMLVRCLLAVALLGTGLAAGLPGASAQASDDPEELSERTEVVELRSATTKTFSEPDGSLTAELYTSPIHYEKNPGRWAEIDSTVVASEHDGFAYENAANSFTALFPQDLSDGPVRVESDGQWVEYALEGAAQGPVTIEDNTATYHDALAGIDLVYLVTPTGLKEDIVVKSPEADTDLAFSLETSKGLQAAERAAGDIVLKSEGRGRLGVIEAPYMFDAAEDEPADPDAVTYELTETDTGYELEVAADEDWLADTERAWRW